MLAIESNMKYKFCSHVDTNVKLKMAICLFIIIVWYISFLCFGMHGIDSW